MNSTCRNIANAAILLLLAGSTYMAITALFLWLKKRKTITRN